jgi:hypothetical protein
MMFLGLLNDPLRAVPHGESSRLQGLGAGHHSPGQGHHGGHGGHGGHQNDQPADYNGYSFYVFGDSFADNGNLLKKYPNSELTRQWYPPYQASGRFSNLLVQSDFIGALFRGRSIPHLSIYFRTCKQTSLCMVRSMINAACLHFTALLLRQPVSPPAHRQTRGVGPAGMNFAAGDSGVFDVPGTPTLTRQVHTFNKLVNDGDIKKEHLAGQSVALVAIDGNDYARVGTDTSSFADVREHHASNTSSN